MGTFWEKSPENMDFWIRKLYNWESDEKSYRMVDYSRSGNVYYVDVEATLKEKEVVCA